MWKLKRATNLYVGFIVIVIFTAQNFDSTLALSDKRLCADENCKEIISLGTGTINYIAGEAGMVSFRINSPIRIISKSAGKDPSLWGIEVNGRQGYAPKNLIRETKILIGEKNVKYVVDVKPVDTVPILNTSEKSVEKDVTEEAKITKSLNVVPLESTEKPLENNTNENFTTETPPAATPVLSEFVDGTEIPTFAHEKDGVVETVQEENIPLGQNKLEESDYDDEFSEYDEDEEEDEREEEDDSQVNTIKQEITITSEKSDSDELGHQHQPTVEDNEEITQNLVESSQGISDNLQKKDIFSNNLIQSHTKNQVSPEQLKEETVSKNLQNSENTKIFTNEIETKILGNHKNKNTETPKVLDQISQTVNKNLLHSQESGRSSQKENENNTEAENKPNNTLVTLNISEQGSMENKLNTIDNIESFKKVAKDSNEQSELKQIKTKDNSEVSNDQLNSSINNTLDVTTSIEPHLNGNIKIDNLSPENKDIKISDNTKHQLTHNPLNNEKNELNINNQENIDQNVKNYENKEQKKYFDDHTKDNSEIVSKQDSSTDNVLDINSSTEPQLNDDVKYDKLSQKHVDISSSNNDVPPEQSQNNNINVHNTNQVVIPTDNEFTTSQTFNDKTKDNSEVAIDQLNSRVNNILDVVTKSNEPHFNGNPKIDSLSPENVEIKISDNTKDQPIHNPLNMEKNELNINNPESIDQHEKNYENEAQTKYFDDNTKDNSKIVSKQDSSTGVGLDINTPTEPQLNDNVTNDTNNKPEQKAKEHYDGAPDKQSQNNHINVHQTNQVVISTENEFKTSQTSDIEVSSSSESAGIIETSNISIQDQNVPEFIEKVTNQEQNVPQNSYLTPYNEIPLNTPSSPSHYDHINQQQLPTSSSIPPNDYFSEKYDAVSTESSYQVIGESLNEYTTTVGQSIPATIPKDETVKSEAEQAKTLPSSMPLFDENKENKGLFATIMGTVNNVLSINKKVKRREHDVNSELDRILFSDGNLQKIQAVNKENLQYCNQIGPNGECPQLEQDHDHLLHSAHAHRSSFKSIFNSDLTLDAFLKALASKILEISELLAFLVIVAAASLFFIFGYYCFCNSSREGALLSKLNQLESSLLATHKENTILKHNLMSTRQKLASIEDNSFGSNDMVVSLKRELEEELMAKARLQEQITVLQKELENAADAGIELNKIVSELLSNQTGDESIISSVENLQKQLNEQQNTILEINASLAEKSRENSELQLLIAEQHARYESEHANLQRDNDELEHEKGNLLTKLDELKNDFDKDITAALEGKNQEIKRLQNEIVDLTNKLENEHTKWQTSAAKIEALEECLKNVRRDPNVNIHEVIDVANVKAQLIEAQKKHKSLKERLEIEMDQRKLAENQLKTLSDEVEKLKQDFNQSEKDKLEAQTRLEVLSNYFKDKENQLQKELSLKEAMWLKQQGETTTTVDRVTAMQEEIQSLKSQNDSLRAEIEAQVAAHKAQTGTLENRAHETWLAARQSDRRYEEARAEATALRRQLTALAGGNINEATKPSVGPAGLGDELTQAPSPIHMESPGSPMLGRMPPPPFLPPPFMGPPPPFMGMPPPPPFVPPGEMRPAPLGRIMSPPPQRSGRFSPQNLDYEDYLDYEGNNTWHRHTYSPPRTYRSLSPTDSRYNYGTERDLMSTYDTETDFSPPPSPRDSRRRGGQSSDRIDNNNKSPFGNTKRNKGPLSSGSEKSFNSPSHHHDTKTKKGKESGGGGKHLV